MEIKEDKQGDVTIVTVTEHLDSATSSVFEPRLLGWWIMANAASWWTALRSTT